MHQVQRLSRKIIKFLIVKFSDFPLYFEFKVKILFVLKRSSQIETDFIAIFFLFAHKCDVSPIQRGRIFHFYYFTKISTLFFSIKMYKSYLISSSIKYNASHTDDILFTLHTHLTLSILTQLSTKKMSSVFRKLIVNLYLKFFLSF